VSPQLWKLCHQQASWEGATAALTRSMRLNIQDGSLFENPWGWGPLNSSTKKRSIFSNSWVAGLILRADLGGPPSLQMGGWF